MDDILRRLGIVESTTTQTREDVIAMKADVNELRVDVNAIRATLRRGSKQPSAKQPPY